MAQKLPIEYVRFYTGGTAAQKLEPANVQKLPEMKDVPFVWRKKTKKIHVDVVALVSILVAFCMIFTIAVGVIQLNQAVEQRHAMEEYVVYLRNENTRYQEEYEASYDIGHIEKTALSMGMVPSSEVAHTTIEITEPISQEEERTLWQSVGVFLTGLFA